LLRVRRLVHEGMLGVTDPPDRCISHTVSTIAIMALYCGDGAEQQCEQCVT
jgi:hypothetical protein